MITIYLVKHFR